MSTNKKQISDYLFGRRQELTLELQGLSHPDRFAIIALLYYKEQSFRYLKNQLSISKTALANHLQNLKQQKIIYKVQRGVYRISEDGSALLKLLSEYLIDKRKREMQHINRRHLQSFDTINEVTIVKTEANTVIDTPEFQPAWNTYAGSIAGVLQAFGEEYDIFDILGYSGYAFLSNISRKSTHIAAPTATNFFEDFDKGISSLGYPFNGFWDNGAVFGRQGLNKDQINRLNKLFSLIKEQLDHNNPVILWGLGSAEFGIVTGYQDEDLLVSTFRKHTPGMDDTSIHYTELDSPGGLWAYYFGRKENDPNEETDREVIERAKKITTGNRGSTTVGTPNEEWEIEQMDFISGPEAFGRWATNIENGTFNQKGNSYVLAQYTEGRQAASIFFNRMAEKYEGRSFETSLIQLSTHYEKIYTLLNRYHKKLPFPQGNSDEKLLSDFAQCLRQVMTLESDSIELFETCLANWKIGSE